MKVKSIKDAKKKKSTKTEKVVDIRKAATEEKAKKMLLQDIIDIAEKMGIHAGDLNRTELVRAIQRAEGYSDCFMTVQVRTCGQQSCLWYQECVLC